MLVKYETMWEEHIETMTTEKHRTHLFDENAQTIHAIRIERNRKEESLKRPNWKNAERGHCRASNNRMGMTDRSTSWATREVFFEAGRKYGIPAS